MSESPKPVVVVTPAAEIDYTRDFVALPREYGTRRYEARADVQAIRAAVWDNLRQLDARTGFCSRIDGKPVILKPNLVTVFHWLGTRGGDSPETTDPRVIDAVVTFFQQYTRRIIIAESSGRGMPTAASFKIAGLDRLAKLRGVELTALEEQPVDRYLLPKARVMREVVVPRLISAAVRGEAFFVSMPKLKTNLYTGVTLGFKNQMGVLSYNLRQRSHHHAINQKLVDLLYLLRPDLVLIDGIVGGEGNCPAPVEPVQSRVIISGNHAVETDRVAARMMGFDPAHIPLLQLADENGFGDARVEVAGAARVTPFRPADPALMGAWMQENFPNVRVLTGHNGGAACLPPAAGWLQAQENACRGGCQASTRYAFDMLYYEGKRRDFRLTVITGTGVEKNGRRVYYDAAGNEYSLQDIHRLDGKKLAVGACTRALKDSVTRHIDGCMPFPNAPHMVVHQLSGTTCAVISPRNHFLLAGLVATLRACERRKAILRTGQRIDTPLQWTDTPDLPRAFTAEEMRCDYIAEPFAPLTRAEIRALCAAENRNVLATFFP
ncbi:MAG TPA: DUF362 domain-containing protein [Anaerolineaceae bacterium]